jgi:hypothetical protein
MSAETEIQFEVWQDGFMVAAADDIPNAQHYMMMYGQDGPVEAKTAITTRFPGFNLVSAAASPAPEGEAVGGALFDCDALTDRLVDLAVRLETKADNASASKSELAPGIFRECMADSEAIRLAVAILQDRAPGGATWKQRAAEFAAIALKNAIALQPHLAPSPAPEGEAWRTVPVELTETMRREMWVALYGDEESLDRVWARTLAASPVVPVGVSREEISAIIMKTACLDLTAGFPPFGKIDNPREIADAILAALRPTDTGANHD